MYTEIQIQTKIHNKMLVKYLAKLKYATKKT